MERYPCGIVLLTQGQRERYQQEADRIGCENREAFNFPKILCNFFQLLLALDEKVERSATLC